jgi:hypothetical protein
MVFDNGREVFFSLMNSSTPLRLRSGQARNKKIKAYEKIPENFFISGAGMALGFRP